MSPRSTAIDAAIARGLKSLEVLQLRSGAFRSFSSPDPDHFRRAAPHHAVFPTALILRALANGFGEDKAVSAVCRKAARFLLGQKSSAWSWNYWQRGSAESKKSPYPDDLDDTFTALAAIETWNGKILDGAALAKVVRLCFQGEVHPGGPYRTWLVGTNAPKIWRDVDVAVNANIGSFWARKGITLPGLNRFLGSRLAAGRYASPYYPSPYPVLYFLSGFFEGPGKARAVRFLLRARRKNGAWRTPLETALALSALLRWGVPPARLRRAATWLAAQSREGVWGAEAFYIDPERQGARHYGGAPALSTAIALEALALYRTMERGTGEKKKGREDARLLRRTVAALDRRCNAFPPGLKEEARSAIHAMARKEAALSVVLLPYRAAESLTTRRVPSSLPMALGAANLLGWAAYDLLDDIWDGDAPHDQLPVADALAREATEAYLELLPTRPLRELFLGSMRHMNEAARWELAVTRREVAGGRIAIGALPDFGRYDTLAKRSLPHAFAAAAVLFHAGFRPSSKESRALFAFFRSYLVARQLNDDAHDWEEDLFRGRLNAASTVLLRYAKKAVVREKDREGLRKLFWERAIFEVGRSILRETARARREAKKLEGIMDATFLKSLLDPLETATHRAMTEAREVQFFLKIF